MQTAKGMTKTGGESKPGKTFDFDELSFNTKHLDLAVARRPVKRSELPGSDSHLRLQGMAVADNDGTKWNQQFQPC